MSSARIARLDLVETFVVTPRGFDRRTEASGKDVLRGAIYIESGRLTVTGIASATLGLDEVDQIITLVRGGKGFFLWP